MAISIHTDMKVRDDLFDKVFIEEVNQRVDVFNANSNGGMVLNTRLQDGHYGKTRFYDRPTSVVSRRDIGSTDALTPTTITQDEHISVKINRKAAIQPTIDSIIKGGSTEAEFTANMAMIVAEEYVKDQVNTAINAVEAALSQEATSALKHDASDGTLAYSDLITGRSKLGDRAPELRAWLIHSKPWHDLLSAGTNLAADIVAAEALQFARIPGIGLPFVITDAAGLYLDATTDLYYTIGLQAGGVVVEESERPRALIRVEGGLENLTVLMQFEFAYNISVKGYSWDTTAGGVNPTDAAVALSTNWDAVVANKKDKAGVYVYSQ